jgi:2-keto-3-deoxy-L-fuconate dehydrogenase
MAGRLAGKVAFITAAAQGMGRGAALAFAREGARVWATDMNAQALSSLKGERIETRVLDVTDGVAIEKLAREVRDIDVLFNCAGVVHHGSILDAASSDWDQAFAVNVKSMFLVSKAFLPGMLRKGRASIINMASVASSIRGLPNRCVYGASKAAVIGLTKSIAADYVRQGIRCNAICPGTVRSPSWEGRVEELGKTMGGKQKALDMFVGRQPMGRVGEPSEIAALATYLASDESAFTTGTAIPIDGGWII